MQLRRLFPLVCMMLGVAAAHAQVLVDTVADFSTDAQGTNGLSYGYFTTANGTTGTFSTTGMFDSGGEWLGPDSLATPQFTATTQHPQVDTYFPAVRRYEVGGGGEPAYTGWVRIQGSFGGPAFDAFGQTVGFVTHNSTLLFSADASGTTVAGFDLYAMVAPGDFIYFGVAPGGEMYYENTAFSATITAIPEPAHAAGWIGVAALLAIARRRARCENQVPANVQ